MPHYILYVYLIDQTDQTDQELYNQYKSSFAKTSETVEKFVKGVSNVCIDAGIDILTPNESYAYRTTSNCIKTGLKCSMYFDDGTGNGVLKPCGYYMYPRSSTGSKTPLRLCNSVGIIDAGYRGELMGFFDNISLNYEYKIEKYQRLLQICSPNLTYPIYPILVDSIEKLDQHISENNRGECGFGSTGL